MIVIDPVAVTPATLISSSVAETDYAAWAGGTTYALGARVIVASAHRAYESLIGGNVGNSPATSPTQWLDIGPTNRWRMFDPATGPRTTASAAIDVTVQPVSPLNAIGIVDATAASVRVRVTDASTAVVYDQTMAGGGAKVFTGLPQPSGQRILITINPTGGVAAIGKVVVGNIFDLGQTEASPTISITDYSRRETDDFGVTTIVERAWAKRLTMRTRLASTAVDGVQAKLVSLRARPALWVGEASLEPTIAYGFFKDFGIDLQPGETTFCSLSIEGLPSADLPDPGTDPALSGASDLQVIRPLPVTDAILTSSNVAETEYPAWASGTTYALGARTIRAHRVFESLVASNVGNDPTLDPTRWLDTGPTKRWAMFDQALGSFTTAQTQIIVTLTPDAAINGLGVLDTDGAVRVQSGSYDRTIAAPNPHVFLDLAVAAGVAVTITISAAAGASNASAGTLLIGTRLGLGLTENSPSVGISDFSRKDTDDFGNVTVVERAWAKRLTLRSLITSTAAETILRRIASLRATPALWVGPENLDTLVVYGFAKDTTLTLGGTASTCAFTIEGLTKAPRVRAVALEGAAGQSAYSILLSNDGSQLPADADGNITSYTLAATRLKVLYGTEDVTDKFALASTTNPQALTVTGTYPDYQVTAGFDAAEPTASITFNLEGDAGTPHDGVELSKTFDLTKSLPGLDGSSPPLINLTSDKDYAKYNAADAYVGGAIKFTAVRQNIPGTGTYFKLVRVSDGTLLYADTSENLGTGYDGFAGSGGDILIITAAAVAAIIAANGTFQVIAYRDGYAATDSVSIGKIKDGSNGANAPLVITQWSVSGTGSWHANYAVGDLYQRQSNDGGATFGAAVRVVGESVEGEDGITPAIVFKRSASVPAAPADNSGNPPTGWSDGPPAGTDFIWQSKAQFRGTAQLTSWSAPQRISGTNGADAVVGALSTSIWPVQADSTGVTKGGQVPRYSTLTVKQGSTDLTSGCSVTVTPSDSGQIAASYSAAQVTLTKADVAGYVDVAVTYGGAAVPGSPFRIQIPRTQDAPPPASQTSGSGEINFAPTSASYGGSLATPITLRANGSGTLTFGMGVSYVAEQPGSGSRTYRVAGTAAYRAAGSSTWSYAAETVGSGANTNALAEDPNPGSLSISGLVLSGLTPDALYEVGPALRKFSGTSVSPSLGGSFTVAQ